MAEAFACVKMKTSQTKKTSSFMDVIRDYFRQAGRTMEKFSMIDKHRWLVLSATGVYYSGTIHQELAGWSINEDFIASDRVVKAPHAQA